MNSLEQLIKSILGEDAESFEYTVDGDQRVGWRILIPQGDGGETGLNWREMVENSWRALLDRDVRLFVGPTQFRLSPGQHADSIDFDSDEPMESPPCDVQVIALPGASNSDVIELCKVGSHNAPPDGGFDDLINTAAAYSQFNPFAKLFADDPEKFREQFSRHPHGTEPWRQVQDALKKVSRIAAFAIQYANAAGLQATFLSPLSEAQATKILPLIGDVNPEAFGLAAHDLKELGIPVPSKAYDPSVPDEEAATLLYMVKAGKFKLWWD